MFTMAVLGMMLTLSAVCAQTRPIRCNWAAMPALRMSRQLSLPARVRCFSRFGRDVQHMLKRASIWQPAVVLAFTAACVESLCVHFGRLLQVAYLLLSLFLLAFAAYVGLGSASRVFLAGLT